MSTTIRPEPVADAPCWELRHPNGEPYEWGEGIVHYPERGDAEQAAFEHVGDPLTPVQVGYACVQPSCACGYLPEDGDYHYRPGYLTRADLDGMGCYRCP